MNELLLPLVMAADITFWIFLFVGCTAVPMTMDMLRVFLPPSLFRSGRMVAAWHRPVLLAMVACLCFWAYWAFWVSVLPYARVAFTPAWTAHAVLVSLLWINTVWNYALCAATDPGFLPRAETNGEAATAGAAGAAALAESGGCGSRRGHDHTHGGGTASVNEGGDRGSDASHACVASQPASNGHDRGSGNHGSTHLCRTCDRRVLHLDHHCPFTGGCIGAYNFRFFLLFVVHCSVGCTYAGEPSSGPRMNARMNPHPTPYIPPPTPYPLPPTPMVGSGTFLGAVSRLRLAPVRPPAPRPRPHATAR